MATTETEVLQEEQKATTEANTPTTTPANTTTGTTGNIAGSTATSTATTPPATSIPTQNTNTHPAYTDPTRIAGIENMYNKALQSQKAQLTAAYDQNMNSLEANRGKIAEEYNAQRQSAAIDYERNRRNLNQQIAASGLNTGTASQSQLALNQQYNKIRGTLGASEGQANANLDKSIADLKIQYQGDVSKAVADN